MRWRSADDSFSKHGEPIRLYDELSLHTGFTMNEIEECLKEKKTILEWMVKQNIHNIEDVGLLMAKYYKDRESVVEFAEKNKGFEEIK